MNTSATGPSDFTISREVDGETLVLDTRTDLIHQLNATASYIWQRLQEGAAADEVAAELARRYEVEPEAAAVDVAETLAKFKALHMI